MAHNLFVFIYSLFMTAFQIECVRLCVASVLYERRSATESTIQAA